jgi:DNA-binding IscR family transcriptional regulator
MNETNVTDLERRVIKVLKQAGALTENDLAVMFGQEVSRQNVLSSLKDRGLVRSERAYGGGGSLKWLATKINFAKPGENVKPKSPTEHKQTKRRIKNRVS